ncbi:hypothetical protein [Salisaeta longa]|uniref:hypothetical protein n=1 Tax=Salisaeta longa TaxID=503170 RepID=UPI0003B76485|nr:hypothetical protein [Salisaeta longa]
MSRFAAVLCLALGVFAWPADTHAQDAPADTTLRYEEPPRATLNFWATDRRIQLLDRIHATDNRTYDRGVFRHITPGMDREYALDMVSYQFSMMANHAWQQTPDGMRLRFGSIQRPDWAVVTQLKEQTAFGKTHGLSVNAWLQQDARASRAFVELGYGWSPAKGHRVGIQHTFADYKPSLDATLFYVYRHPSIGAVRATVTALDVYNDFIYEGLGVEANQEDIVRTYGHRPFLLGLEWNSPARYPLRAELVAHVQTQSAATLRSQREAGYAYTDVREAAFGGALLAYERAWWTVGVEARYDRSALQRTGLGPAVQSAYATEQTFWHYGAFAAAHWGRWRTEATYAIEDYTDRQSGRNFELSTVGRAFRYNERRHVTRIQGTYDIAGGAWPYVGLEYAAVVRNLNGDKTVLTRNWTSEYYTEGPSNYRVNLLLGYRFRRGSFVFGVGYDTDNDDLPPGIPDSPGRFDNAYSRLTIVW